MRRTLFGLLLAVLLPDHAVLARPPAGLSGQMVLDEVADGLRRYRAETNSSRRAERLAALACPGRAEAVSQDPRVAVALGDALEDPARPVRAVAFAALSIYCGPESSFGDVEAWWERNKAELRRRAKQLPE